jgi:glycosyltransferase involved in cell wall biosynthesis
MIEHTPESEKPLVSVVIPTCNRRAVLERCLIALTRQTYPKFEVIVIDDFSSDGTGDLLENFFSRHPALVLIRLRNETLLGANPSRNRGILASRGDFVAFLDSDCIAEPDWLERLIGAFTSPRVAAVSGLIVDPLPGNIYELTFKGTHRLHRSGPAHRLIAGNMCVRRGPLLRHRLDEDRSGPTLDKEGRPDIRVSGRGDEEGLFLRLKAAGHEICSEPRAVVFHEHHLDGRTFFRQAFRGGRSAARLVYKYYLPHRLDMVPFLLAHLTLPAALVRAWLLAVPAFFFAGALMAVTYNDLVRKGKTWFETLRSFPVLVVYYHVRLAGYVWETLRLRLTRTGVRRIHLDEAEREVTVDSSPGKTRDRQEPTS